MSLNLGPAAFEAVTNLRNNSDWRHVVAAIAEQMSSLMHRAVEVPAEQRADATGYARAIRDLAAHIEMIEHPPSAPGNRVPKPPIAVRKP